MLCFCISSDSVVKTDSSHSRWICGHLSLEKHTLLSLDFSRAVVALQEEGLLSPLACQELSTLCGRLPLQQVQYRLIWLMSLQQPSHQARFEQVLARLSKAPKVDKVGTGDIFGGSTTKLKAEDVTQGVLGAISKVKRSPVKRTKFL